MYVCMHACMYVCVHVRMHACMYVCMYVYMCVLLVRLFACLHVYVCVPVVMPIYISVYMQDFWSLEIVVEDHDTESPNDLIDVIFACSAQESNHNNFSHPQTYVGALGIAEINLSFHLRCDDIGSCGNVLQPDASNSTNPNGNFEQHQLTPTRVYMYILVNTCRYG